MDRADVAIIGGGIVGSAVAYFLSKEPRFRDRGRILLVEHDPSYTEGSTGRSAGGVRMQFSDPGNIALSRFSVELFRTLKTHFGPEADVSYREQGYLILASPEGKQVLAENVAVQRAEHAPIALLDPAALAKRFPWLATQGLAAGAFGEKDEGWFDPPSLAALMRKAAVAQGVTRRNDRVAGITVRGERIAGITLAGGATIACDAVVNAAGPWAGAVARLAGIDLPVEPRKRYVYVLDVRDAPAALYRAPLTVDPSGVWFRPEGRLFICGKSPEPDQEPPATNLDQIDYEFFNTDVWPDLAARVPTLETVKVVNAWAGYYDYNTLDQNAVIGAHPHIRGFYFANGFSGHGAQQAAAAGRGIAELIAHGQYTTLPLDRFGYARIAANRPLLERNII